MITITAKIDFKVKDGIEVPINVNVKNAEFLAPSAISAIAQEALDEFSGTKFGRLQAGMPDWGSISNDMNIAVIDRGE